MKNGPPKFPSLVLSKLLRSQDRDAVLGDIEELFFDISDTKGEFYAKSWFWIQMLKSLPGILFNLAYWSIIMYGNFLKTAYRNLSKHKGFSLLNIFGLTIGMASCILILMFVMHELSYDRFNKNAENIYRVNVKIDRATGSMNEASIAAPAARALKESLPEVIESVRFRNPGMVNVRLGNRTFQERRAVYADQSIFDVFTINLLKGDKKSVLTEPGKIILSRSAADRYFGSSDPINQSITWNDTKEFTVSGIYEDFPTNSHIRFNMVASMKSNERSFGTTWMELNFPTYLLLEESASPELVSEKVLALFVTHGAAEIEKMFGKSYESFMKEMQISIEYSLEPLLDIHLHSNVNNEFGINGDIRYVYILATVAALILLIACINYTNLSTARSAARAKEVGIRKTAGSHRTQLITQFMTESILISMISCVLSVSLAGVALPLFNEMSGKQIHFSYILSPEIIISLLFMVVITSFLAGGYPALFISSFQPVKILKGNFTAGSKRSSLRNVLVIAQFSLALILISGTITVTKQLSYIGEKDIGYNKEHILILNNAHLLGKQAPTFKEEMKKNTGVLDVTVTSFLPIPSARSRTPIVPETGTIEEFSTPVDHFFVDHDFIRTMGMSLYLGRDFDINRPGDNQTAILNRAALQYYNMPNPLNQKLYRYDEMGEEPKGFTVIGVVEDFHFQSFKQRIKPLVIFLGSGSRYVSLRINPERAEEVIGQMENIWERMAPDHQFTYTFLDDKYFAVYTAEQELLQLASVFTTLAIILCCLGLFGLASFTTEQRTKEIGIRKVLGSSVPGIITLLSRAFLKPVLAANIIALPAAYYLMNRWLMDFAYRIEIGTDIFLSTALLAIIITGLSVGFQTLRAAKRNPAASLRYE